MLFLFFSDNNEFIITAEDVTAANQDTYFSFPPGHSFGANSERQGQTIASNNKSIITTYIAPATGNINSTFTPKRSSGKNSRRQAYTSIGSPLRRSTRLQNRRAPRNRCDTVPAPNDVEGFDNKDPYVLTSNHPGIAVQLNKVKPKVVQPEEREDVVQHVVAYLKELNKMS